MPITRREIMARGSAVAVVGLAPAPGPALAAIGPKGLTIAHGSAVLTRDARPSLAWRYAGEQLWRVTRADDLTVDAAAAGVSRVGVRFGDIAAALLVGASGAKWTFAGELRNHGDRAIELKRFDYLNGVAADPAIGLIAPQKIDGAAFHRPGDRIAARNPALRDMWSGMRVTWGVAPDPVYGTADWALSNDVGIFTGGWQEPGWTAGFTGPGIAFGEIGLATGDTRRLFVGQLLDGIVIDPGERRTLEQATIRHGDWQEAMAAWVVDTAKSIPPRPAKLPAVGFCSWYQFGPKITAEEFAQATREIAALPDVPGGRLVQIDDGYQVSMGDWSPNVKFKAVWDGLPARIRATGSVPGTYLAPVLVSENHPSLVANPDWVQRTAEGVPAINFSNWEGRTVAIDPNHPGALAFMRAPFEQRRVEGWEYIKVDFTYAIAPNRVTKGLKRTTFETHRAIYAMIRDAVGPDMQINACVGEPARYAIGLVDACRLYGDIGTRWASVKGNLLPLLLHAPTGGRWFIGDPDVFYMRQVKTELTPEENWLLTGSIGLMGGLFLTSDFPSQWSEAARARIARFWNASGPRTPVSQRIMFGVDGSPLAYRVSYADGRMRHRVGIYNWANEARDTRVSLRAAGVPPGMRLEMLPGGEGIAIKGDTIGVAAQPAHSLRIADLVLVNRG